MSTPSTDNVAARRGLLMLALAAALAGCATGPKQAAAPVDNVNVIRPVRETAVAPAVQASTSTHVTTVAAEPEKIAMAQQAAGDFFQGLQLMKAGKLDDAMLVFQQLAAQYPTMSGPLVNQALILQKKDKPDEALELVDQALKVNPKNPFALNLRGMLLRGQGKFADARAAYEQALAIDPQYAKAHFNLGVLADLYLQDLQLALDNYEKYQALQTKPDPAVNNWIADLKNRLGIAAPAAPRAPSGPAPAQDEQPAANPDGSAAPAGAPAATPAAAPAESAEPQPAPAAPAAAQPAG